MSDLKHINRLVLQQALTVYHWVNRINELRDHRHVELNGLCAVASAELWRRCDQLGVKIGLHMAISSDGCHVFNSLDGVILDLTMRQFEQDYPGTFWTGSLADSPHPHWHRADASFDSMAALQHYQVLHGWPQSQQCVTDQRIRAYQLIRKSIRLHG